ncbi:YceI family protein [Saccharomonospora sp. NPDC046836]|uniref:YceI family protein n=1 Tax=Saccharomonospora sp. NPDC046836 TaxID=3156921 RepID=UPI0033DF1F3C
MPLPDGHYRLVLPAGRLLVRTSRTGLGARAGHDLTIEAIDWSADVTVRATDPGQSSVTVEIGVDSLEVRSGSGGVKPLTASDRAEIRKNLQSKVLHSDQYPKITFRSTRVSGGATALEIAGELTIMSRTEPIIVHATVGEDGQVTGRATVAQTRWGIKPYSALLGALKLADEVSIEVDGVLASA